MKGPKKPVTARTGPGIHIFPVMILLGILLLALRPAVHPVQARVSGSGELITAVNALRASNGLTALKANSALMAAAQAHSEYQAANETASHTGEGGSTPSSRAAAYGYGGGGRFYVSENIATGGNMSAQAAVNMWSGDGLHLSTMLNAAAVDIGAGEASSGDAVYYTLLVGYVSGQGASASTDVLADENISGTASQAAADSSGSNSSGSTSAIAIINPVKVATPNGEGAIIHVVEEGQALWNIADAYQITLLDLLATNGMTEKSVIYPGEKLFIRYSAPTAGPSPTETPGTMAATSTYPATATRQASPTAAIAMSSDSTSIPVVAPASAPENKLVERARKDPLLLVIGVLLLASSFLLVFSAGLGRHNG